MSESFDYVIVGAGSAGCVLANRLCADPGNSVLLLEAGPEDKNPWIHVPIGYYRTIFNPAVAATFVTEPEPELATTMSGSPSEFRSLMATTPFSISWGPINRA